MYLTLSLYTSSTSSYRKEYITDNCNTTSVTLPHFRSSNSQMADADRMTYRQTGSETGKVAAWPEHSDISNLHTLNYYNNAINNMCSQATRPTILMSSDNACLTECTKHVELSVC